MGPVIERTKLVEGDVTNKGVTLIIEGRGDVAGDTVILRIDILCGLPGVAGVA